MRTAVFDIESSALDGIGAGILLSAVVQDYHTGSQTVFRLDDHVFKQSDKFGVFEREERELLKDLYESLSAYDLWVGHNIIKFDIKFLMTRAMRLDLPWELRPFAYDTMQAFRRTGILTPQNGFGKPQAGLGAVADALGIPQEKTKIMTGEWWFMLWGNKTSREAAMDACVQHCEGDVSMTAKVYSDLLQRDLKATIKRVF
jgi:uncharacterized protein YprB with RNaseH-like and TPR domain